MGSSGRSSSLRLPPMKAVFSLMFLVKSADYAAPPIDQALMDKPKRDRLS